MNRKTDTAPPDDTVLAPPNPLRTKIRGSGPASHAMLAKAEKAVETFSDSFAGRARQDLEALKAVISGVVPGAPDTRETLQRAYVHAHELRGQGGTSGYHMITRIAASLCRLLDSLDSVDDNHLAIIDAHIDALNDVLKRRAKGEGAPIDKQTMDGLEQVSEKYLNKSRL